MAEPQTNSLAYSEQASCHACCLTPLLLCTPSHVLHDMQQVAFQLTAFACSPAPCYAQCKFAKLARLLLCSVTRTALCKRLLSKYQLLLVANHLVPPMRVEGSMLVAHYLAPPCRLWVQVYVPLACVWMQLPRLYASLCVQPLTWSSSPISPSLCSTG